jgi:hypothetical protein
LYRSRINIRRYSYRKLGWGIGQSQRLRLQKTTSAKDTHISKPKVHSNPKSHPTLRVRATSHASTAIHTVFSIAFIDSPGSVIRTVASLRAGRSAVRIPVEAGDFISAAQSPDRLRDPPSPPFIGYPSSFPECDCNHPPPYSVEVKNEGSYTSNTRCAFMGWTGKT